MTTTISVDEAGSQLADLIARLGPGDEVVLTENDRPVATLVSSRASPRRQRPGPGLGRGLLTIVEEDDEVRRIA